MKGNSLKALTGKVAIVTGGARGIGLTYALRLASLGAHVATSDLNLGSAQQYPLEAERLVGGSLEKTLAQHGTEVHLAEFDAVDQEANERFAQAVHARWGRIDVVICNAGGGSDTEASFASELKLASARTTFDRNFFSTVATCTAVAPFMKAQRSGKIVNISSMAGVMSGGGRSADYAAAKAAVAHYTRKLAHDLAPHGATANAIAPGYIASGQFRARFGKNDEAVLQDIAKLVPLGRLGTPEDCANVIEFLSTSLSDYVTGQVIPICGGMVLSPS